MTTQTQTLSFTDTLKQLRAKVPKNQIKSREGYKDRGGKVHNFDYVEWHTVADILDDAAPSWTHSVKEIREVGDICTVIVAITIDGVTREGIGTGNVHNEMGIKKAEHDALKRAAVKFGVGRELYKKESDVIETQGAANNNFPEFDLHHPPTEPMAANLASLVTQKQLGLIRAISRELAVDHDEECNTILHCRAEELSKNAASWFIKYLQELQLGKLAAEKPIPVNGNGNGNRRAEGAAVSVQGKAKLLAEGGFVKKTDDHYEVTETVDKKQMTFTVAKVGTTVTCDCLDYTTHSADPTYACVHKVAVRIFTSLA